MNNPFSLFRDKSITLMVNGQPLTAYLTAEITRGIEVLSAEMSMTVGVLADGQWPLIKEQDEVQVMIGSKTVATAIVLAANPSLSRGDYGIQVICRDRTGDLTIGAAIHKGGQWLNTRVDQIARDLCAPYDINVVVDDVDIGKPLARFELSNGETVAEALSRACKYRAVLLTRNNQGDVVLCTAGTSKAPVALVTGKNIISINRTGSDAERCSEYIVQGDDEVALKKKKPKKKPKKKRSKKGKKNKPGIVW